MVSPDVGRGSIDVRRQHDDGENGKEDERQPYSLLPLDLCTCGVAVVDQLASQIVAAIIWE